MIHWNTDKIVNALGKALPTKHIRKDMAGGDVDTESIIITMDTGDQLFICGFKTNGYYGDERSDVDVEMVELSCGKDSRGGMHGVFEPETIEAYGKAMIVFKELGFDVVPTMDGYF